MSENPIFKLCVHQMQPGACAYCQVDRLNKRIVELKAENLRIRDGLPAGAKRYEVFRKRFLSTAKDEGGQSEWEFNEWLNCQLFDQDKVIKKLRAELSKARAEAFEEARRVAVRKMVQWTEHEDSKSAEYRLGVEEGAAKIAVKLHAMEEAERAGNDNPQKDAAGKSIPQ